MVDENDDIVLPVVKLGTSLLNWVKEVKCLGVWFQSRKGLRVNIDTDCRKFISAA